MLKGLRKATQASGGGPGSKGRGLIQAGLWPSFSGATLGEGQTLAGGMPIKNEGRAGKVGIGPNSQPSCKVSKICCWCFPVNRTCNILFLSIFTASKHTNQFCL